MHIIFSTLINICMVLDLLPVVGIPLPFVSYGITHQPMIAILPEVMLELAVYGLTIGLLGIVGLILVCEIMINQRRKNNGRK